jgi:hypothetical protein
MPRRLFVAGPPLLLSKNLGTLLKDLCFKSGVLLRLSRLWAAGPEHGL